MVGEPPVGGGATHPSNLIPSELLESSGAEPSPPLHTQHRPGQPSQFFISMFCSDFCFFLISSSLFFLKEEALPSWHLPPPRSFARYSQHPEYPHREANHSASTNLSQENLLRDWDH